VAHLTWTDASDNETGFDVERQPTFEGGALRSVGANVALFDDTTIGGTFAYRIRAVNAAGASAWTAWLRVNILPAQGGSVPGVFSAIIPGLGWTGPTEQPAAVGNPTQAGYDAKAIARWDVVPFQTFTGDFNVGVVAFHMNGIDRVEFAVNGGPWTSVREMQLNPQTNVWEYTARLRASDFAVDGPVEVRAVAWPVVGEPRVLGGPLAAGLGNGEHSMFLSSNSQGSLSTLVRYISPGGNDVSGNGTTENPYATMMKAARSIQDQQGWNADGGTIYLLPGDHVLGTYSYGQSTATANRWLTISAAPGVARSEARIIRAATTDGLRTKLVRFYGLTFAPASGADQGVLVSNGPMEDYVWVDNCEFAGPGRAVDANWSGGLSGQYSIDCTYHDCRDGPGGVLVRGAIVQDIGSDALSGSSLAVNCTVGRIDHTGTTFHPDVLQYYGALIENRIAYGIIARTGDAQGFFAGSNVGLKDVAFVQCDINNQFFGSNVGNVFQFGGPVRHMLVRDSIFVGPARWRTDLGFTGTNVVVERAYADTDRAEFLVPSADHSIFPGVLPWTSPLSIRYRVTGE
jgi:hypothetical protein